MNKKMIVKEYLIHFFTYNELALYLGVDFYDVESIITNYNEICDLFDRKTAQKVFEHNIRIEKWNTQLDDSKKFKTEKEKEIASIAQYIIDNKCSIREAAKVFGKGKTTIHESMTDKLPNISITLYKNVFDVLQGNKSLSIDYKSKKVTAYDEYNMLKNGYTIKEISNMLNLSYSKVQRDLAQRFSRIDDFKSQEVKETLHEHQMRFNK